MFQSNGLDIYRHIGAWSMINDFNLIRNLVSHHWAIQPLGLIASCLIIFVETIKILES